VGHFRRRYAISDGDADVVTVKEMLAAASSPNALSVRAWELRWEDGHGFLEVPSGKHTKSY